jgi:cytoskeleton protein RodZ
MSGFGERMRREREMRGVSLEEISESTKIGTRSLKAIEDNEFDKLPGGIFNKGFVRAYSKFLGLDEDETVADFDAAWKEYQVAHGQPIEPVVELQPAPEPPKTPWFAIASVIVLLAAIFGLGWLFMLRGQRARTGPASQLPAIAPAESSELQPVKTQSPAASPEPGTTDPSASTSSTSATKTSSQSSAALEESKGGADKPATALPNSDSSAPSAVAVEASPIQLKVVAHEDSWYSLSADGKDLGQGILGAEKSRSIRAQKEVRLKLGNAGGVEISFNGKPVNLDGEPKQVRELTFTPDGLHQ